MITRTGFYIEVEVVFKSKAAEHSRNSNDVRLLRDAGSEAVVLEDLKLEIEVISLTRVFNFIYIELS
jgi:aspartate ammonia-lyase